MDEALRGAEHDRPFEEPVEAITSSQSPFRLQASRKMKRKNQ